MPGEPDARWWEALFNGEEAGAYQRQHGGQRNELGRRPCLLVVDVVRAFTGWPGQTLAASVADWPTSCGPAAWRAMPQLRSTLDLAVNHEWPVVYTTARTGGAAWFGGTVKGEISAMGSPMDLPGAQEIPGDIAPPTGALIIDKPKASAFFGTVLLSYLIRTGVDCLVVTGATTSGCVRATVVDGHSHGYPVFVVEEACFDRARLSHGVSLFEMNAKYADVLSIAELAKLAHHTPG